MKITTKEVTLSEMLGCVTKEIKSVKDSGEIFAVEFE